MRSHPTKWLEDHLEGVTKKVVKRTTGLPSTLNLKTAEVAATFHDLGKINPNFQRKLDDDKAQSYSSHAYLSAFAWFCFAGKNLDKLQEWFGEKVMLNLGNVGAMIARHHGDLPNFEAGIFNQEEAKRLTKFLSDHADLPISDFLQMLVVHESFSLQCQPLVQENFLKFSVKSDQIKENPLGFFLETQFGFACLLEADKRDAGANETYKRDDLKPYFQTHLAERIEEKLSGFKAENDLNRVRPQMREEAVESLRIQLNEKKRVFTLSAPTSAGKTMMLLALAKEIHAHDPDVSVIYALPFLSITEQVEAICKDIFKDNPEAVLRVDSRSENERIQKLQAELEQDQSEAKLAEILRENFSEETFDHRFTITTFVQLFETMVSNKNATLLRLPNFSRSIFLLDEIQALPPRLYLFFVALLDEFCRQFDSYAIVSTATMPYLELNSKTSATNQPDNEKPEKLFRNYRKPEELLSVTNYFDEAVFNRYRITKTPEISSVELLAEKIKDRDESCLVILNTIDDTKRLYELLRDSYGSEECVLLNTHFTLNDRRQKLNDCQQRLKANEKIILVSTQLIEAGVDIDFPVLYRDLCPLPNLIQSAGRCNRNGKLLMENVYFIALRRDNGNPSAELIYRGKDKILLNFGLNDFPLTITESEMKTLQEKYFEFIGKNLSVGVHDQVNAKLHLIRHINKAEFVELGKFHLIDEREFGEEYRYYIPTGFDDESFEKLQEFTFIQRGKSFTEAKARQLAIETQLRKMTGNIVQFRVPVGKSAPSFSAETLGIRKLADDSDYSSETGIRIESGGCFI